MIKSPKQWMANTGSWILERNDMLASLTTYNPSTNWVFGNCSIENPLKKKLGSVLTSQFSHLSSDTILHPLCLSQLSLPDYGLQEVTKDLMCDSVTEI